MIKEISWNDFEKVKIHAGTIIHAEVFEEARIPAFKLNVDLGELGVKKSSARIADLYQAEELIGKQVLCVVNFPPKQIGPFISEVLVLGCYRKDGSEVLVQPDKEVHNGAMMA